MQSNIVPANNLLRIFRKTSFMWWLTTSLVAAPFYLMARVKKGSIIAIVMLIAVPLAALLLMALYMIFAPGSIELKHEQRLDLRAYIGGAPRIPSAKPSRWIRPRFTQVLPRWGMT